MAPALVQGRSCSSVNQWAKGNSNETKLCQRMNDMQSKFTTFARQFLSLDPVKLKKTQTREFLTHELEQFNKAAGEVEKLLATVMELQARHQLLPASSAKRAEK